MRAKAETDGLEDVGLMVTTAARFRTGSFSIATWAQRVRGETWPKVILLLYLSFFFGFFGFPVFSLCVYICVCVLARGRDGEEGGKVQRDFFFLKPSSGKQKNK